MNQPFIYPKLLKQIPLWCFVALLNLPLFAQNATVSGKITATNGEGLPGVSVLIKGTTNGTITNDAGDFQLAVPSANATLVCSFVGFTTQEIALAGQTSLNITLLEDAQSLSEVVVTGYGNQKKSDFLGSVTSIKAQQIQEMPVVSMEQAMQGRLAGVQVQQSSGQPGAGISIRVRGVTSIAGGNEPLFVIDGIPQFNSDNRFLNGMSLFNSNDIESIEVLKDASATAIYGSRGANGVVMITTKGGKIGQNRITYDASFTNQNVIKEMSLMTGDEYLAYAKQWFTNSSRAIPAELNNAVNANTDWQKALFSSALQQNHNLSFSGGSDKTQFYVSGNFTTQPGIVLNSQYNRGTLRFNLNTKLNDRLGLRTYMTASKGASLGFAPSDGTPSRNFGKSGVGSVVLASPTIPIKNANGTYGNPRPFTFSGIDVENPMAIAEQAYERNELTRFQGGMDFNVTLLPGLVNTARFGADNTARRNDIYLPIVLGQLGSGVGIGQLGTYGTLNLLGEDYLEYKKSFGDFNFEGIVGASIQTTRQDIILLQGTRYISDDLKNFNFSAAGSVTKPVTDIIENNLISAFSRIRLNYKDKYLASASLRRDGASVFSKNKKYGIFPSVGLAWRISQEDFLKNSSVVSNLKLRSSWGQAGNPAIQPYQSLLLGNIINTAQGGGSGIVVGLAPTLPNDNLTWETTTQTNIGFDAGLFNERYRITFDYYNKNTTSLLATVQLPPSAGYSTIIDNVGKVENKGFELELGTDIISTKDLRWAVDANISINKNKVLQTKDNRDLFIGSSIIRVGQPLSAFWGPKFNKFDDNGRQLMFDLDNNNIINALDNQVIGSPYPDFMFGVSSSLRFKQLSLSMTWSGVQGNRIDNQGLFSLTAPTAEFNHVKEMSKYYPKASALDVHRRSDLFIEDGSYVRLRNVRLDYRLPLGEGKGIKSANFYVSGQNLLTFTNYSGYDPEVNSYSGNDLRQGVDIGAYPGIKSVTFGLSVGF